MYIKICAYHPEIFCARALRMSIPVILRPIMSYANEGNPGSWTFCLPFYYQALSRGNVYATYCAYGLDIFGARVLKITSVSRTQKLLGGHFVYANKDNAGTLKFWCSFRYQALSIGSMYAKSCTYHTDSSGTRAVGMSTIVICGSTTIYANERIPEVETRHRLFRLEAGSLGIIHVQ